MHEPHAAGATVQSLRMAASHAGVSGPYGGGGGGEGATVQPATLRARQKKSICSCGEAATVLPTPACSRQPATRHRRVTGTASNSERGLRYASGEEDVRKGAGQAHAAPSASGDAPCEDR